MRILLANLRLYCQWGRLWALYVFVAFILIIPGVLHLVRSNHGDGEGIPFAWVGLVCGVGLAIGTIVVSVQIWITSKPLSFCLPNHRTVSREIVFLVGLVLSLLLVSIALAGDSSLSLSPLCLFGASLTAYFAGASIGPAFRSAPFWVVWGAMFLPVGGAIVDLDGSRRLVATPALAVAAIAAAVVSAAVVWRWLGRADVFRDYSSRPWLDMSLLWYPATRDKYRWIAASPRGDSGLATHVEGYLLGRMRRCRDGSAAKCIWGSLYTWLLPGGGGRLAIGLMVPFGFGSAVLAWYVPESGPIFLAYGTLIAGAILGPSPLQSPLLVVGGRRERFLATMVFILIVGTVLTLSLTLAFEMTRLLGMHTLTDSLYAKHPEFLELLRSRLPPVNLRLVILSLALFPVSRFLEVRLRRMPVWMTMAQMAAAFPVVVLNSPGRGWLVTIPGWYVALIFILLWALCAYGVHRVALHSDLGRP